jgi:hypothetical protein
LSIFLIELIFFRLARKAAKAQRTSQKGFLGDLGGFARNEKKSKKLPYNHLSKADEDSWQNYDSGLDRIRR